MSPLWWIRFWADFTVLNSTDIITRTPYIFRKKPSKYYGQDTLRVIRNMEDTTQEISYLTFPNYNTSEVLLYPAGKDTVIISSLTGLYSMNSRTKKMDTIMKSKQICLRRWASVSDSSIYAIAKEEIGVMVRGFNKRNLEMRWETNLDEIHNDGILFQSYSEYKIDTNYLYLISSDSESQNPRLIQISLLNGRVNTFTLKGAGSVEYKCFLVNRGILFLFNGEKLSAFKLPL